MCDSLSQNLSKTIREDTGRRYDRLMPVTPASKPSTEPDAAEDSSAVKSAKPSGRSGAPKPSRRLMFAALAVALIGAGVATVECFLPWMRGGAPSSTGQQIADAKTKVCAASLTVRQAVVTNTHLSDPVLGDPVGALAVAANARLALYGGGGYLRDRVSKQVATPPELAQAANAMADTLQELSMGYLSGLNSSLDPLRHDLDSQLDQIERLCQ